MDSVKLLVHNGCETGLKSASFRHSDGQAYADALENTTTSLVAFEVRNLEDVVARADGV